MKTKGESEIREMQLDFLVALIIFIPFISFPVLLWHLDIGGRFDAIRKQNRLLNEAGDENRIGITERIGSGNPE